MLSVWSVISLARGHVWWETPNLLGSTFYGVGAFRSGPGWVTVSGAALQLVICGMIGVLFGLVCGAFGARRYLVLFGLGAGVAWYLLADPLLWSRFNPRVSTYIFIPGALFSHLIFGACLGWMEQGWEALPKDIPSFNASGPDDALD